jgi:hypothetical protein
VPTPVESPHADGHLGPNETTRLVEIEETAATRAGAASERRRLALVVGAGKSYDFYHLLLRRLQIFSSMLAAVLAGVMALMLWNLYTAVSAGRLDELGGSSFVLPAVRMCPPTSKRSCCDAWPRIRRTGSSRSQLAQALAACRTPGQWSAEEAARWWRESIGTGAQTRRRG